MATLTDSTNLTGTITLSKATGTKVTLDTDKKYLTKDIELTINAPSSTITTNGATVSYTNGWVNAGSTTVTDSNLIPANIVDGVTIFGVTGNYTGSEPTELWEEIIDQNIQIVSDNPNYFVISNYTDSFSANETYRVTWGSGGTQYICETIEDESGGSYDGYVIGNPGAAGFSPDTGEPFLIYKRTATQLAGATTANAGTIHLKIERQINANINLQAKTNITPTESSQIITPDSGYDALSSVQINAISSTYVGSGITRRSSTDLTASGATVTVPAGYYSTQTTKSVSSGSATGPSTLSGSSATLSTGTNTITLTKTNVTTTPTVSAGYVSSATASTATVTLTASVTTKAAATITPGTSNQTIASGTYLTGTQTIAGDADLVASNIISTANIFGVQGSVVINKYYTGSSAPASNLGNNGDIYIQQEDA